MTDQLTPQINWRHPLHDPLPEHGQKLFFIDWHWKEAVPGSYQIKGGTFAKHDNPGVSWREGHAVEEGDEHGGSYTSYPWPMDETQMGDGNFVGAWVPAEDINLPDWLIPKFWRRRADG